MTMKLLLILSIFTVLTVAAADCGKKSTGTVKYKARLEIKGICFNYTISLLDPADTLDINADWTDEMTNKSYSNVFSLGNPCDFPATIKQGDEFYFTIDTATKKDCAVCMAYYPKPSKALTIKVVDK